MQLPETMVGHSSKAYASLAESIAWVEQVTGTLAGTEQASAGVFLCSPAPVVPFVARTLNEAGALVGCQDVSRFGLGPFTGETPAQVLAETGSQLVMVGHPERAALLGEQLSDVRAKCEAAAAAGLVPILIVGEPQRDGAARQVVDVQLAEAFADVPPGSPIAVAYEPTWAIGQPEPAPADYVVDVVSHIRDQLADRGPNVRILYGGSAGPGTFTALVRAAADRGVRGPDGVFLGRFGLDAAQFLETVAEVRAAS